MSAISSANTSFEEPKGNEPLTPNVKTISSKEQAISTPVNLVGGESATAASSSSKFKLFDATTPLTKGTNLSNLNASAPPFLRNNSNDVSLNPQILSDIADIDLTIRGLDLNFNSNNSNPNVISTTSIDPQAALKKNSIVEGSIENSEASIKKNPIIEETTVGTEPLNSNHVVNRFNEPGFPHHHPFPPFSPMNGFGQPLPSGFNPGKLLDHPPQLNHPQPWSAKPGHFPNGLGAGGMESLAHVSPIPPPGMIPIGPFDFGPDGVTPPLPHHLHDPSGGFVNLGDLNDENGLKGVRNTSFTPPGFPQMDNSLNHPNGLQNNQLWPPLNGPQSFDNSYHVPQIGGIPLNGLGMNNNPRFFPNSGHGNPHHHNHHNNHHHHHHGRKYMGHRKPGEDASKFANAKLEDFIGQIYSLCKDQHGCRFLQKQLDLDEQNSSIIFKEVNSHVVELMIDPFGNYLIQKLLENVNDEERINLVQIASPHFVQIALDSHGTRALQKLVECINSEKEAKVIVESLKNDVVLLSTDLNGNHVIQKCLQRLNDIDSQFIFDAASKNCLTIATHRHGCCVLQRCLDFGSEEQCKELSLVIASFTKQLSLDPYGNYVIQYVLTKKVDEKSIKEIVEVVKSSMIEFALHKFGSNVIEKCLNLTIHSPDLISELINNEQSLVKLMNDSYGNYVLQTALDNAKSKQFQKLSLLLKPLLPQVRNTPHGRRISNRIEQTTLN